MNLISRMILILTSTLFTLPISYASENIFYVLRQTTPDIMTNLKNHSPVINIIISQAYQVDPQGKVWGSVNPDLANFAKAHALKVMIMVTNAAFDNEKVHQFLKNSSAGQRAIKAIVKECQQNHYAGVQFDFESIALKDRAALTHFLQSAATELHHQGFLVSFAVAPVLNNNPQQSAFLKRSYEVWEGAYDVKALGKSSDFLTLMTYNQHTDGTTPGSTASYAWVEQAIKYALQSVPAKKISLGIATYSSYWYTGQEGNASHKIAMRMDEIPYNTVQKLLQKNQAHLQWDNIDKVHYAAYEHHWLKEYIFVEDAKSFQTKLNLVKKYNLRGISVFRLGIEDPNMWKILQANK